MRTFKKQVDKIQRNIFSILDKLAARRHAFLKIINQLLLIQNGDAIFM